MTYMKIYFLHFSLFSIIFFSLSFSFLLLSLSLLLSSSKISKCIFITKIKNDIFPTPIFFSKKIFNRKYIFSFNSLKSFNEFLIESLSEIYY
jgi:hypothetical protein